jgi:hypothetical protein
MDKPMRRIHAGHVCRECRGCSCRAHLEIRRPKLSDEFNSLLADIEAQAAEGSPTLVDRAEIDHESLSVV